MKYLGHCGLILLKMEILLHIVNAIYETDFHLKAEKKPVALHLCTIYLDTLPFMYHDDI